ncbi:LGFP repeat-containing protein [Leucobacter muris]|nr:hypothetical protein [Leucobacter muris]
MRAQSKWRGLRAASIAVFAAAAFVMSLLVPSLADTPAQANPSAGFEAGNIIDDALFYDGTAWSAGQIQSFLDQRVPRCTIGDAGREAYAPYGNTTIAGACLKGSLWTTAPRPADSYCRAMAGATNESAASYIARVGAACGISPKVLLVMLEKEQSLVTDTWPTFRQYDFAMGAYCPDSGPGGSANCDPGRAGFPNQLYNGARLLKIYKAFPNSYNYKPFQSNRIQWHPNAGCGTSDVWIENWATAALYIYTPYRPNQAALNAGWGTGDACSSYGNRNFYNFYTTWFGSTHGITVDETFVNFYNEAGGVGGLYGRPLAAATHVGIGKMQEFAGGTLYWNPYAGIGSVNGAIRTLYNQMGGAWSALGYPMGREGYAHGGAVQQFERGTAYWTARTGASAATGTIRSLYTQNGGPAGAFGFPKGVEKTQSGGLRQEFEGATAYWSPRTKSAAAVSGDIRTMYHAARGANSEMGFPKSMARAQSGGLRQEFEGATAYWSSRTGAAAVSGDIRAMYHAERGANSEMGFPKQAARSQSGGLRQEFEGATAYWSPRTKSAAAVSGDIRTMYHAARGANSEMGFPKSMARAQSGGLRQEFEGATAYWSPRTNVAAAVSGDIRALYHSLYGANGSLGFPLGPVTEQNGTRTQRFEGGSIVWTAQRGAEVQASAGRLLMSEPLPDAASPETEPGTESEPPTELDEQPAPETEDAARTEDETPLSNEAPAAAAE